MNAPDPPHRGARDRPHDIVLWGATGFVGQLVAAYLLGRRGGQLRIALGGRDPARLEALRRSLSAGDDRVPLLVGDSGDPAFLARMAAQTEVVCSTVGPYARHGAGLVAACVAAGTHYCDLTGEVPFIRRMIDAHHEDARRSGTRIVHACGFDSIPSDLGTLLLQHEAERRTGRPCQEVTLQVLELKGGVSGGTLASMVEILEQVRRDPAVGRLLADPYALNPEGERSGADSADQVGLRRDPETGCWTGPFVMAGVNTRVVRRSNALLGYPYGRDFRYAEVMRFDAGPRGLARATATLVALGALGVATAVAPLRRLLAGRLLPRPGEGPSEKTRSQGHFAIRLEGRGTSAAGAPFTLALHIRGAGDPGYAATARMLGESAACLATQAGSLPAGGGVLTPAAAMGLVLVDRLRDAGLSFAFDGAGEALRGEPRAAAS